MNNMKQTQDDRTIQPFNCSTIQRVKAYAFTLAETLIVIGIIGVVAALTLPNLNHATGDKEKVTKVKKIYASLTEAFDRAQAIYGDFDTWFTDLDCDSDTAACNERAAKRITEFMKISKYYAHDDEYCPSWNFGVYCAALSDGTMLGFKVSTMIDIFYSFVFVDIDGTNKGKNQQGYDWFNFTIRNNDNVYSVVPDLDYLVEKNIYSGDYSSSPDDTYVTSGYYTAWIIQNDNLDYLKCPDELNWETKTSCE